MKRLQVNQFKELKKIQAAYLKAHEGVLKVSISRLHSVCSSGTNTLVVQAFEVEKQANQKVAEEKKKQFTAAEAALLKAQLLERDQLAREHAEEVKTLIRST